MQEQCEDLETQWICCDLLWTRPTDERLRQAALPRPRIKQCAGKPASFTFSHTRRRRYPCSGSARETGTGFQGCWRASCWGNWLLRCSGFGELLLIREDTKDGVSCERTLRLFVTTAVNVPRGYTCHGHRQQPDNFYQKITLNAKVVLKS